MSVQSDLYKNQEGGGVECEAAVITGGGSATPAVRNVWHECNNSVLIKGNFAPSGKLANYE